MIRGFKKLMNYYNNSLRILFGISLSLVCVLSQSATAEIFARDIRIGIHKDKTRVVLELSEDENYQVLASKTEGYLASDINLIVRDVFMERNRKTLQSCTIIYDIAIDH